MSFRHVAQQLEQRAAPDAVAVAADTASQLAKADPCAASFRIISISATLPHSWVDKVWSCDLIRDQDQGKGPKERWCVVLS